MQRYTWRVYNFMVKVAFAGGVGIALPLLGVLGFQPMGENDALRNPGTHLHRDVPARSYRHRRGSVAVQLSHQQAPARRHSALAGQEKPESGNRLITPCQIRINQQILEQIAFRNGKCRVTPTNLGETIV